MSEVYNKDSNKKEESILISRSEVSINLISLIGLLLFSRDTLDYGFDRCEVIFRDGKHLVINDVTCSKTVVAILYYEKIQGNEIESIKSLRSDSDSYISLNNNFSRSGEEYYTLIFPREHSEFIMRMLKFCRLTQRSTDMTYVAYNVGMTLEIMMQILNSGYTTVDYSEIDLKEVFVCEEVTVVLDGSDMYVMDFSNNNTADRNEMINSLICKVALESNGDNLVVNEFMFI